MKRNSLDSNFIFYFFFQKRTSNLLRFSCVNRRFCIDIGLPLAKDGLIRVWEVFEMIITLSLGLDHRVDQKVKKNTFTLNRGS